MASESGIPARDLQRHRDGTLAERGGRATPSAPASRARPTKASSFKLWLRYAKPAHGRLTVDERRRAGAARARLQPAAGRDHRGRRELRGRRRGRGRRRRRGGRQGDRQLLRRGDARGSRGCKSAEVRELMPHAAEEAVHRDHFVLPDRAPPAPLRACAGEPTLGYPSMATTTTSVADELRSRQARVASAGRRRDRAARTRRSRRPRGCSTSAGRRSSRPTPPIWPTSGPLA